MIWNFQVPFFVKITNKICNIFPILHMYMCVCVCVCMCVCVCVCTLTTFNCIKLKISLRPYHTAVLNASYYLQNCFCFIVLLIGRLWLIKGSVGSSLEKKDPVLFTSVSVKT